MLNKSNKRRIIRSITILSGIVIVVVVLYFVFKALVIISPPDVTIENSNHFSKIKIDTNYYIVGDNWLKKNSSGLWEMYISGEAYQRGLKCGLLSQELVYYQEHVFVSRIKDLIPSEWYRGFLRYVIAWFNKDLDKYIPLENQLEIYGISNYADSYFDFIGNNYQRILNYHAAHDIGHAMQNLNLVACTSFGVWDEFTADNSLLIGRNFDFHAGEDFSVNKIVAFYSPEKGYRFAMITWGGMTGVVSGMNMEGLTITLNAAKSEIPLGARTPVSIVARNILQYAANIEEAYDIACKFETFVTETFLIGSASDGHTALIEKTLDTTILFECKENFIVATNHLQHPVFSKQELNLENMAEGTSVYRYNRVKELIHEVQKFDYRSVATVLRDQHGIMNINIGMGNEKTINQLIAHHAVIFKPEKRLMWVSTNPYQIGKFVCYDLNKVFSLAEEKIYGGEICVDSMEVPADTFLYSKKYISFKYFKDFIHKYKNNLESATKKEIDEFIKSNPEYFYTYEVAGDYYNLLGDVEKTIDFYNFALEKEVASESERKKILNKLEELNGNTGY